MCVFMFVFICLLLCTGSGEPPQLLRGFDKVQLAAGGKTTVYWTLTDRDLSIWDVTTHTWKLVKGQFTLSVGASSRDIRAHTTLTV